MTDNHQWLAMADRTLMFFGQRPPQMLVALDFHLDKPEQIIIAGKREAEDTKRILREVHSHYIPNRVILLAGSGEGQRYLSRFVPFVDSARMMENKATVYSRENYACKLPASDPGVVRSLLVRQKGS